MLPDRLCYILTRAVSGIGETPVPARDPHGPSGMMPEEPQASARGKVAAILVLLLLLACGFWLMQRLRIAGSIQDCVATGHSDCGGSLLSSP